MNSVSHRKVCCLFSVIVSEVGWNSEVVHATLTLTFTFLIGDSSVILSCMLPAKFLLILISLKCFSMFYVVYLGLRYELSKYDGFGLIAIDNFSKL